MLDPRAASGFTLAADYARTRPNYPDAAWDVLIRELSIGAGTVVVDLAAGTGQVAGALHGRVGAVIAVEPVAEMRAELARRLPEILVVGGLAEALPLDDGSVDAVVVGEAFHWFAVEAAAGQIARVLRLGGGLGLLWNTATWTEEDTPWLAAFRALVADHKQAAGPFPAGDGRWHSRVERTELFERLRHVTAEHRLRLRPADFPTLVCSWSWVANLPAAVRERLRHDIGALVRDEHEIDIPYRTDVYWTRRQ